MRRRWRTWAALGAPSRVLRWIREGFRVPWRQGPPRGFHMGESLRPGTLSSEEENFIRPEIRRLLSVGALRRARAPARHVSRAFLVPKPHGDGYRLVFDLRYLNGYVRDMRLSMETLKRLRLIARRGDHMVSFDIKDGFYHVGLHEADRRFFQVSIEGVLYEFAALPMGFKLSPAVFCQTMSAWTRWARAPAQVEDQAGRRSRREQHEPIQLPFQDEERLTWERLRRTGLRLLPYVDDFLLLGNSAHETRVAQTAVYRVLQQLGIRRHPTKGAQDPTHTLTHLGLEVDTHRGVFRVPTERALKLKREARSLLCDASRRHRALPVKRLAHFAGLAQSVYLAVPAARFFLRALHDCVGTRTHWTGTVRLNAQARRDLEWWREFPLDHAGRTIWTLADQAVLHCDASTFGWGGVLNGRRPTRGLWSSEEVGAHITLKELRAVRLTIEAFLPELRGRRVLLHEDNQAVVSVLTRLTSASPALMSELRRTWWLLDANDITVRARYIRSAANVWADALSRETGVSEASLSPGLFDHAQRRWGLHTIDRFATANNRKVSRYNAVTFERSAEAIDALAQSDRDWQAENNWVHPPRGLLEATVAKLQRSGAAATVVAPTIWGAYWHQQLMALTESYESCGPGRRALTLPGGRSLPAWCVSARAPLGLYRVPLRPTRAPGRA